MSKFKLETAKPKEVEAYAETMIRFHFGDLVENKSRVFARNGFYFIEIKVGREKICSGAIRRRQIKGWIKGQAARFE